MGWVVAMRSTKSGEDRTKATHRRPCSKSWIPSRTPTSRYVRSTLSKPQFHRVLQDHYINVPFDLSQVLFVATANSLDTVSDPLLDRCEVIQLSGYTYDEKIHIARRFLLPKQLEANGLPPNHISLTDAAYTHVTSYYTREAGVRNLERCLGAIARSKAVEWAEFVDGEKKGGAVKYQSIVDAGDLEKFLGIARWDPLEREREERRGLVYGLVVSGMGEGGVLPVESVMTPGTGKLRLTGSLGDVRASHLDRG